MEEKKLVEEANAYISNDLSVEETAKTLGISRRTLQIHLRKIKEINPELYKLVLKKQQSRTTKEYSPKYIEEALEYINNDLTLEQTAQKLGISKRTLQLHFEKVREIDLQKKKHKK